MKTPKTQLEWAIFHFKAFAITSVAAWIVIWVYFETKGAQAVDNELVCTVTLSKGVKDIEVGSGAIVCLPEGETYAAWTVANHQHWSADVETPHKLRFNSYGQASSTQAFITSKSGAVYSLMLNN
nr:hypothetical protein [uncultured Halomonas sp.]